MMEKSCDWIICSQEPDRLARHPAPVVWINVCLRCGTEEPVYQGPVDITLFAAKHFTKRHKDCEETH